MSWQARRFIAVVIGIVVALTYGLWGQPLIALLAWLATLGSAGLVLGGLIASAPAALAAGMWLIGDAADATGHGRDEGLIRPLDPERRSSLRRVRLVGWLLVFGLLVGMLFSTSDVLQSWSRAMDGLVTRIEPGLGPLEVQAVASMLQAFPIAAAVLFLYSLLTLAVPARLNRWPGSESWIPGTALAAGVVVWLAVVLAAVFVAIVPAWSMV